MQIELYTKDACPACTRAKKALAKYKLAYKNVVIGVDINREQVLEIYPEARMVPLVVIDGSWIGGYEELAKWIRERFENEHN